MGGTFLSQPNTNKKTNKYQHRKLRVITCEMQGWRKNMEDAVLFDRIAKEIFLFGVFDGHGGCEIAQFSAKHFSKILQQSQFFTKQMYKQALEQTFKKLDELLDNQEGQKQLIEMTKQNGLQPFQDGKVADSVGATANVVLIVENIVYVANAGDSRSALSRGSSTIVLSEDHKPEKEGQRKRIEAAGGVIDKGRINGHLNLSRCLGDLHYKKNKKLKWDEHAIICKPDIKTVQLCKQDDFIIIGCDGVWQKYEDDSKGLTELIRQGRMTGKDPELVLEEMLDSFVAKSTTQQIGCDNMSAILIEFNKLLL